MPLVRKSSAVGSKYDRNSAFSRERSGPSSKSFHDLLKPDYFSKTQFESSTPRFMLPFVNALKGITYQPGVVPPIRGASSGSLTAAFRHQSHSPPFVSPHNEPGQYELRRPWWFLAINGESSTKADSSCISSSSGDLTATDEPLSPHFRTNWFLKMKERAQLLCDRVM